MRAPGSTSVRLLLSGETRRDSLESPPRCRRWGSRWDPSAALDTAPAQSKTSCCCSHAFWDGSWLHFTSWEWPLFPTRTVSLDGGSRARGARAVAALRGAGQCLMFLSDGELGGCLLHCKNEKCSWWKQGSGVP